jgi:hypothetical protein
MLDRFKFLQELEKLERQVVGDFNTYKSDLYNLWMKIRDDNELLTRIASKKWSLLVPFWQGSLKQTSKIIPKPHAYAVLAVDGSQIYYDKHQGPACSLINVGTVFLHYQEFQSFVDLQSYPEIIVFNETDFIDKGAEFINLYREKQELTVAFKYSLERANKDEVPFLCMFDGSLIFFQADKDGNQTTINFFAEYMAQLELFFQNKILNVAYMSFPRTKDLINVARLANVDFCEKDLEKNSSWAKLSDMDLLSFFLKEGERTIIFETKAPISYAYPKHLKPYFCYLNVGIEIIRLEFCGWIAQDISLVDMICGIALDQAQKGNGYPVALFEAHEQAVIKSYDREFFYEMIKQAYLKHNQNYQISLKRSKKLQVPV